MRFLPAIIALALTLCFIPALAQQPVYLGSGYGNSLFYSSLNTPSDLWNWGTYPNGIYYDSPYGDWVPSILTNYYPRNYYYWPYYNNYPWGMYQTTYYPYQYSYLGY